MNAPLTNQRPTFSFVIPAFDEGSHIARTIEDIKANFRPDEETDYEILVIDNGSSDETVQIAESAGCRCLIEPTLGISDLRNRGAEASYGELIVFIDADVSLTLSWRKELVPFLQPLLGGSRELIGSHYQPCAVTPLPVKLWYIGSYENPRATFLPGGHTILSRSSFDEIGGFDPAFSAGEDIDFCHRAAASGFAVLHCPEIGVVHQGDPQSIGAFLKRECWHGASDFESIQRVFRSRTAIATLFFVVAHGTIFVALFLGKWPLAVLAAVGVVALLLATTFHLFPKSSVRLRLLNTVNAYLYYVGRTCSLRALFGRSTRGRALIDENS